MPKYTRRKSRKSRRSSRKSRGSRRGSSKKIHHRALFIGIDGLRIDALLKHAKNIKEFGNNNVKTWNSRVKIPISAASWSTIFSGLSSDNTGVTNNAFTGKNLKVSDNKLLSGKSKTIFHYLKKNHKKSLLLSAGPWDGIHIIGNYNKGLSNKDNIKLYPEKSDDTMYSEVSVHIESKAEYKGINMAIDQINNSKYDFITMYTHNVDANGHAFGHNPTIYEYREAIKYTDKNIKSLFDAVKNRERKHKNEKWLIIMTTDHGGSSREILSETDRGKQTLKEFDENKQINAGIDQSQLSGIHGIRKDKKINYKHTKTFIILKTPDNKQGDLGKGHTNMDITPTIIKHLLPRKYKSIIDKMDGKPLI